MRMFMGLKKSAAFAAGISVIMVLHANVVSFRPKLKSSLVKDSRLDNIIVVAGESPGNNSVYLQDVLDDLVVVSGYWQVNGNPKRSVSHYRKSVEDTLDYLRLFPHSLFYHNIDNINSDRHSEDSSLARVLTQKIYNTTTLVHWPIEEKLLWKEAIGLMEICQQQDDSLSNCVHQNKAIRNHASLLDTMGKEDHRDVADASWTKVVAIWISKFEILLDAMRARYPDKNYFAWLDGGLATRIPAFLGQFIPYSVIDDEHVFLRSSIMCFNGSIVPFRAGIMVGERTVLEELVKSFRQELDLLLQGKERPHLCYDEEMIMASMYRRHFRTRNLMTMFNDFPFRPTREI